MTREYKRIAQYEQELLSLKSQGLSIREISVHFGLSYIQTSSFFKRYNKKQRTIAMSALPSEQCEVNLQNDALLSSLRKSLNESLELRSELAKKDAMLKQLQMESDLTRDFLWPMERRCS